MNPGDFVSVTPSKGEAIASSPGLRVRVRCFNDTTGAEVYAETVEFGTEPVGIVGAMTLYRGTMKKCPTGWSCIVSDPGEWEADTSCRAHDHHCRR